MVNMLKRNFRKEQLKINFLIFLIFSFVCLISIFLISPNNEIATLKNRLGILLFGGTKINIENNTSSKHNLDVYWHAIDNKTIKVIENGNKLSRIKNVKGSNKLLLVINNTDTISVLYLKADKWTYDEFTFDITNNKYLKIGLKHKGGSAIKQLKNCNLKSSISTIPTFKRNPKSLPPIIINSKNTSQ